MGDTGVYHVLLALQCIYGCSDEGKNGDGKGEWKLHDLLYADVLVLCGDSEEELRAMVECFVEVCRKRGARVTGGE